MFSTSGYKTIGDKCILAAGMYRASETGVFKKPIQQQPAFKAHHCKYNKYIGADISFNLQHFVIFLQGSTRLMTVFDYPQLRFLDTQIVQILPKQISEIETFKYSCARKMRIL